MRHVIRQSMAILAASLCCFVLASQAAPVEANKATEAELRTIKGIGPRMAAKLLDARKQSDFKDWNDMVDRVPGVGPGNASKMSAHGLTVNGTHYGAVSSSGLPRSAGGPSAKGVIITPPSAAAATQPTGTRPAVRP